MTEPLWVNPNAVLRFHGDSLIEFGGSPGIRDRGAIESALARPRNLFAHGKPDLCALAAAYTAGLCQNHGFVDGNERTAVLTGFTFLYENGYTIVAEQAEVAAAMLSLADRTLDEAGYAAWLREHIKRNQIRLGGMKDRIRLMPEWDAPVDIDRFLEGDL